MKYKNVFKLIGCIVGFITLFGTQSCSDMSELSDRFLDDGSIVYAAKVDSVSAHPGDGRIEMEIFIKTQRIDYVRIYWNDKADYKDVVVNNQPGTYNVSFEMDESSYVFNLISVDKYGNESLPVEVSSEVFGDNFRQTISNRLVRKASYDVVNKTLSLNWSSITNFGVANEIIYTNTSGKEVAKKVAFEETVTELADWAFGLKYRTLSLPDPLAVDTFYTSYDQVSRVSLDKNTWTMLSFSSQVNASSENRAQNVINDIYTDRWHSAANGYPGWIVIDFGGEVDVKAFGVTPSVYDIGSKDVDVRFPTTVRFEVSMDNVNWTSLGDFTSINTRPGEQIFDTDTYKARYYRFTGVKSDAGVDYMVIGELDAYLY